MGKQDREPPTRRTKMQATTTLIATNNYKLIPA